MTAPDGEKLALVTGAGRGIGRGIAARLVADGMTVVLADIDGAAAERAAARLGATAIPRKVDVADEDSVRQLLAWVGDRWGRLHALVNNAGIADPFQGPLEQLELADWRRLLATNLDGVFLCSKHALPLLREAGGSIVNIASTRALQSEADTEAYAASKGGVVALTHAMAISLGPQVRVNCISPGWIVDAADAGKLSPDDHAQHPVGRVGRPADIAALVAWLVSAQAGFATGQNFVVDGGMTRKMIYAEG